MDSSSDPNNSNILPSQIFTTVAALLPAIDRRVVVVLRDGRKFFGVLRSFDQFGTFSIFLVVFFCLIFYFSKFSSTGYFRKNIH